MRGFHSIANDLTDEFGIDIGAKEGEQGSKDGHGGGGGDEDRIGVEHPPPSRHLHQSMEQGERVSLIVIIYYVIGIVTIAIWRGIGVSGSELDGVGE